MKRVATFCAALAILLGVSSGANASLVFDFTTEGGGKLGVPDSASTTVNLNTTGGAIARNDQFTFEILFPAVLNEATLVLPTDWFTGTVRLFQIVGTLDVDPVGTGSGDDIFIKAASVAFDVLGQDVYGIVQLLTSTSPIYYITVDGTFSSGIVGNYSVQLKTLLPVPIPPVAVLFLSALAGLVGFSRIRRRKAVAERL